MVFDTIRVEAQQKGTALQRTCTPPAQTPRTVRRCGHFRIWACESSSSSEAECSISTRHRSATMPARHSEEQHGARVQPASRPSSPSHARRPSAGGRQRGVARSTLALAPVLGEATVMLLKAVITAFPSVSLPILVVPLRSGSGSGSPTAICPILCSQPRPIALAGVAVAALMTASSGMPTASILVIDVGMS
eukprot:SAG22_NODE_618_length_8527_cov_6.070123_4_plen_192_part_00